ncbi:MAG: hypothetical protein FADNKDHG_01626 [Holosporales bacterium]
MIQRKKFNLHELSQKQLMIVFDSGNHRKDIIEALKSTSEGSFQESMIDVDSVVTHTANNFPAIPESKSFMNNRKDTMLVAIESKRPSNILTPIVKTIEAPTFNLSKYE